MQMASSLATSAGIDPPAEPRGADRWTVTSECEEIGPPPLSGLQSLTSRFTPTLRHQPGPHQKGYRLTATSGSFPFEMFP